MRFPLRDTQEDESGTGGKRAEDAMGESDAQGERERICSREEEEDRGEEADERSWEADEETEVRAFDVFRPSSNVHASRGIVCMGGSSAHSWPAPCTQAMRRTARERRTGEMDSGYHQSLIPPSSSFASLSSIYIFIPFMPIFHGILLSTAIERLFTWLRVREAWAFPPANHAQVIRGGSPESPRDAFQNRH